MADKSILELINEIAADANCKQEVVVLPLMCGTGKSAAISYKIKQTIEEASSTGNGLLIITDRKDRMDDYLHKVHDKELQEYLSQNENEVTIMHHDNLEQAYKTFKFRPVLIMTTQRFFRLTIKEIEQFLQWERDDMQHYRPLILIDERPELTTVVELNERKIHDCSIAIEHAFQSEPHHTPDVEIRDAEEAFSKFADDCNYNNNVGNKRDVYCFWSWYTPKEYSKYMKERYRRITRKREEINNYTGGTYYEDYYTRIRAIYHLVTTNALFYHHWVLSAEHYTNTCYTLLNNSLLLNKLKAKTIILDGTAKFSPEYRLLTDDIPEYREYFRNLEHLKIHVINLPTGKTRMQDTYYLNYVNECVRKYYEEKISPDIMATHKKCALFTYKGSEKKFHQWFPKERVEHFGNIIGKNDFREAKHVIQVGLNRYPDAVYYLYYLALHPEQGGKYENMNDKGYDIYEVPDETLDAVLGIPPEQLPQENTDNVATVEYKEINAERIQKQSTEIAEQMNVYAGEVGDIMNKMLFAELEQNIFRGIIRNDDCAEDYHFHLFTNVGNYSQLIKMMKDRYEPLGGVVDETDWEKIQIDKIMRRKGESYAKKFLDWHDNELDIDDTYTPEDIRNAVGILNTPNGIKVYENMFSKTGFLRSLLESEKDNTRKRGLYRKKGNWTR